MTKKLTNIQAFNAMTKFLQDYYERTESEDIGSLLSEIAFLADGETADPAAWGDWLECVELVLNDLPETRQWLELEK